MVGRGADIELEHVAIAMRRAKIRLNGVRPRRARADMRGAVVGPGCRLFQLVRQVKGHRLQR